MIDPLVPVVQLIGPRPASSDGAAWASVTSTLSRVTFPLLVTAKVYVTVCPTAFTVFTLAVLTTEMSGVCVELTVAVEGSEVIGTSLGVVPVDVAESLTEPLSRSACVTVYVASNVAD